MRALSSLPLTSLLPLPLLLLLPLLAWAEAAAVTVNVTGLGLLAGSTATTRHNRTFYQFLAVPYATATTRFQEATPVKPWNGTRNVTSPGPACVQFTQTGSGQRHPAADADPLLLAAGQLAEDENCLTMDIYSPNLTASLPVLVYVHGGAFVGGSSQQVQPHFLLDHDLVLVAPQYRLGPLGFLSLGAGSPAAGNAGLLDQLAALRWVQKNIARFGGNATRVTLAGGSAGAASAALLQLSPLARQPGQDLFQQVFLESGSALAPWSLEDNPFARALVVATVANCTNITTMLQCLQAAPVATLKSAFIRSAVEDMLTGGTGLGAALPSLDLRVLPRRPLDALRAADYRGLPLLVGVAKHEGLMPLQLLKMYKKILDGLYPGTNLTETFTLNDLVRRVMMIEENRVATDAVADKYFKPGTLSSVDAMTPSLIDLGGAVHFKGPAITTVEYNSKTGNQSYLYSFNHQDVYNYEAVGHSGDFPYLFPQPNINLTAEEQSVSEKMVQLVANFVNYGNVSRETVAGVPAWRPYTVKDPSFMLVDVAPQLRQDFERQLTVAADEGLRKKVPPAKAGAAAAGVLSVATVIVAAAALALH